MAERGVLLVARLLGRSQVVAVARQARRVGTPPPRLLSERRRFGLLQLGRECLAALKLGAPPALLLRGEAVRERQRQLLLLSQLALPPRLRVAVRVVQRRRECERQLLVLLLLLLAPCGLVAATQVAKATQAAQAGLLFLLAAAAQLAVHAPQVGSHLLALLFGQL